MATKIFITPPPRPGGGPTNAVLRIAAKLPEHGIEVTTSLIAPWRAALLNVGLGVRFDALRLVRLGRRLVYRVDGCYSRELFDCQNRAWEPGFEQINRKITRALREASFVIYQSSFAKNYLDELHPRPAGSYDIVPNGVDVNVFSPGPTVSERPPTVGSIGVFRANRVKMLLAIARALPMKHRLLLVGRMDEECRKDLADFAGEGNSRTVVDHVAHVTDDASLVEYYRQIDCFVHPVVGDTCSNAVIEALACGVPVVLPRFGGSSVLIGDGGLVVETDPWLDYKAFIENYAEAVTTVLGNQPHYAMRARERACDALDVNAAVKKYVSALGLGR